jgi:hypothetical protein
VITVDAGHTVRARATLICEDLLARYVMTVKGSTPGLFSAIDALDWAAVPVSHQATGTGHGRTEKRTTRVMDAPEQVRALFPHARQVFLIERCVTRKVRRPQVQDRDRQVRGGRPVHHQPVGARGRPGAPGRLRPRPLVHREQDPLGP